MDEAVVDELKPYLVGDFPPLLSDPFPSFDKRRGPPVSQHQAKELAKVHKRLAKKHEIGRKRLDAVESVPVCVGTEVLRASSTGWSGLSSGYGKKVQHAELQARNVSLIRYESVSPSPPAHLKIAPYSSASHCRLQQREANGVGHLGWAPGRRAHEQDERRDVGPPRQLHLLDESRATAVAALE